MARGDPIQDLGSIDVIGARKDGVDLLIVASSRLDGSPQHQKLVLEKIATYLDYINSPEFHDEFGNPHPDKGVTPLCGDLTPRLSNPSSFPTGGCIANSGWPPFARLAGYASGHC